MKKKDVMHENARRFFVVQNEMVEKLLILFAPFSNHSVKKYI